MKRKHRTFKQLANLTLKTIKLTVLEDHLATDGKVEQLKGLKYPKVEIPVVNVEDAFVTRDSSIWSNTLGDVLAYYDARPELEKSIVDGRLSFNKLAVSLAIAKRAMPKAKLSISGKWYFLGNRYLKTSIDKDIGHRAIWVSRKSLEDTINLFSNRLFGKTGKLLNGNFTKMSNYISAGTMGSFGINKMDVTYSTFNSEWDGMSITTLDYLTKVNPSLANHVAKEGSSVFKMVSFGHLNGYIVPIKGTVIVLRSRNELRAIDSNLDIDTIYNAAKVSFVSSDNEIKLMPDGVKLGTKFQAVFGVHNVDTDKGLNRPSVTLHSQLLQRTKFNRPDYIKDIIRKNVEFYLDKIKSKEGFYSVFSSEDLDLDSLATFEVDMAHMLPISADKRLFNSSLTVFERGLHKMVELKVAGISVFPIPSSTLSGANIAMSKTQANIISKIIRTDVVTGSVLNIKRDPNVGTGYFPVTVEVRSGLNAMRGILISREVASLLGADYDGDRISVTAEVFGGVKPAHQIPDSITENGSTATSANLIQYAKLNSTGDSDIDNLVAATTGRRIGIADSLATDLMFYGARDASLFFANHVEQAIINSVKHIKGGIIDIFATYANVCNFLGIDTRITGKPMLYKMFTGKLGWEDIISYNPEIDCADTTLVPAFDGVREAVKTVGIHPWILEYNKPADEAKWKALRHAAKYSVSKVDPNSFNFKLPTREVYGKHYVNYFKNSMEAATPVLKAVFAEMAKAKVGVNSKEEVSASRNNARRILRERLDRVRFYLHSKNSSSIDAEDTLPAEVTYLKYVSNIIARMLATDALYTPIMLAFSGREISAALNYLRTVHKMYVNNKGLLSTLKAKLAEARAKGNYAAARVLVNRINKGQAIVNIMNNARPEKGLDIVDFADRLIESYKD